jgi:selT/selW/selH-like putative selenoprotein
LAAEIREKYPQVDLHLVRSGAGRFEVEVDQVPVYEKSKTRRHAQPGEVVRLIEQHLSSRQP